MIAPGASPGKACRVPLGHCARRIRARQFRFSRSPHGNQHDERRGMPSLQLADNDGGRADRLRGSRRGLSNWLTVLHESPCVIGARPGDDSARGYLARSGLNGASPVPGAHAPRERLSPPPGAVHQHQPPQPLATATRGGYARHAPPEPPDLLPMLWFTPNGHDPVAHLRPACRGYCGNGAPEPWRDARHIRPGRFVRLGGCGHRAAVLTPWGD